MCHPVSQPPRPVHAHAPRTCSPVTRGLGRPSTQRAPPSRNTSTPLLLCQAKSAYCELPSRSLLCGPAGAVEHCECADSEAQLDSSVLLHRMCSCLSSARTPISSARAVDADVAPPLGIRRVSRRRRGSRQGPVEVAQTLWCPLSTPGPSCSIYTYTFTKPRQEKLDGADGSLRLRRLPHC